MNYTIVSNLEPASVCELGFVPTLAIGFYRAGKEEEFLKHYNHARSVYPELDFIGCSSESNIYPTLPHIDSSNHTSVFVLLRLEKDAYSIERIEDNTLAEKEAKTDGLHTHNALFFGLSEPSVEEKIAYIQKRLTRKGTLYGMIASSGDTKHPTTLFYNGRFLREGAIACFVDHRYYEMRGVSLHTFEPIGLRLRITKAQGYTLFELEDRPALEVIEEIIGTILPKEIASFEHPLFLIRKGEAISAFSLLSSIQSIDREAGSIVLYREITSEHRELKISTPLGVAEEKERFERLLDPQLDRGLLFLFVCIGVKQFLGTQEHIRIITLAQQLEHPLVGCHAFGEIGPSINENYSQLQNQTMTLLSLSSKETK